MKYEPIQLTWKFAILTFELYLQCYWLQATKIRAIFQFGRIFAILLPKAVNINAFWYKTWFKMIFEKNCCINLEKSEDFENHALILMGHYAAIFSNITIGMAFK